MSLMEEASKQLGRFYTHFLYRDLIYIAGGVNILSVPATAHSDPTLLSGKPWWVLIALVLVCYALGFFAQEAGIAIGLFRMYPRGGRFVEQEIRYVLARQELAATGRESALLPVERIILLKHVSAVLGASSLLSLLLLQLYYFTDQLEASKFLYLLLSGLLLAVTTVMALRNWRAAFVQDKVLRATLESAERDDELAKPPETRGALTPEAQAASRDEKARES